MASRVLIVEDEPAQRRILEEVVKRSGFEVLTAESGAKGLDCLRGPGGSTIELVILDLMMPEMGGLEFLENLQGLRGDLPVIVQTSQGSIETVIKAMRAGADDFVVKPVSPERLKVSIQNLLKVNALTEEVKRLNKKIGGTLTFNDLVASASVMGNAIRLGKRAAQSNIPVLVEGESGVGKEMIARAIQGESDRAGRPFITVNCGAIPENLVESILFGHEKGSFTGATAKHIGKFQEADGGTLFLDEVAELPLDMQVKLLRAIQEKKVRKVGSTVEEAVDVRIISATHRMLKDCVDAGSFRQDLYYRLNVIELRMPPLRERQEDVEPLVAALLVRICGAQPPHVEAAAMRALKAYSFPGNVRELENVLERATALCSNDTVLIDDLQLAPAMAVSDSVGRDGETLDDYINRVEKQAILEALTKTDFNRTAAARLLGVTFRSLRYRIERLGIEE